MAERQFGPGPDFAAFMPSERGERPTILALLNSR
jgi:hypothetical protein